MLFNSAKVALSLPLLAMAQLASATASSNAVIDHFQITLIDLDSTDGIAPTLTFTSGIHAPNLVVSDFTYRVGSNPIAQHLSESSDFPIQSISKEASTPHGAVKSELLDQGGGVYTLQATGSASVTFPTYDVFYQGVVAINDSVFPRDFVLSANTLAIFSGVASLSASITSTNASILDEQASASFTMTAKGLGSDGVGQQRSDDALSVSVWNNPSLSNPISKTTSRLTSVSFANTLDNPLSGQFSAYAQVSGRSISSAVPEPGHWALLLAGLGVVGLNRRRTLT